MAMPTSGTGSTGASSLADILKQSGSATGAAGGGIAQLLMSLFGKSGMDVANPYLNQMGSQMQGIYSPYMQAGQGAMGNLQGQYGATMNDPTAMVNKIMAGYKESPWAKFQTGQATNSANQAAAAGGMVGSPQEQQQLASAVSGITSQDQNNYLQNSLGQYNQAMQGEQGMMNQGFNASNQYGNSIQKMLEDQASLAYASNANKNQGIGGGIGSLFSGIGGAGGLSSLLSLFM